MRPRLGRWEAAGWWLLLSVCAGGLAWWFRASWCRSVAVVASVLFGVAALWVALIESGE